MKQLLIGPLLLHDLTEALRVLVKQLLIGPLMLHDLTVELLPLVEQDADVVEDVRKVVGIDRHGNSRSRLGRCVSCYGIAHNTLACEVLAQRLDRRLK